MLKYTDVMNLSPQAKTIYRHMQMQGDISALDAMVTYGITSASLTSRICDLEKKGVKISRVKRKHPVTGRKYTRYSFKKEIA